MKFWSGVSAWGAFHLPPKCEIDPNTRLVFLGIYRGSVACHFEAPEDKLEKPEVITYNGISSSMITFRKIRSLRESAIDSLSVAVPVKALYTHHMYKQLAIF